MINLNKHQAIVVQGPMEHDPMSIAKFYSQFDNVVWSTWDDTPDELVQNVQSVGINVLLNKKPKFNGWLNINYQFFSTFAGIKYFLDTNSTITEILKIRSDLFLFGAERLLNRLNGSDISFMYMYNKDIEHHKPKYYLDYWHHGMDFPADFIIHGNINTMYNVFNFQMEYFSDIPPESIILRNYLLYKGFDNNFDIEYLKSIGVLFFGKWTAIDNFYSLSTKNGLDLFNPHSPPLY
jgi:hypothetical protein